MNTLSEIGISLADLIALGWFLIVWSGYIHFTRHKCNTQKVGLLAVMNVLRKEWANAVLQRENRIMDSQLINGLIRKETFFASTTLLILVSTLALMGVSDEVLHLFQNIPFAQKTSQVLWELKVFVLIIIFIFAFFKFTWSIRQHSYCSTLLGAIPPANKSDTKKALAQSKRLAELSSLAANHFNDGLRAYYFALAELSWFFHPIAFLIATTGVIIILYRREYHSKALAILS